MQPARRFTPTQAQSNRRLTVTINFVDNAGTAESRVSAITTVVGDLFPGAGDSNTGVNVLAGTAGQDVYHGGNSNDNLSTGNEADLVSGDAGDDTVSTGGDADTITFSGTGEGFDAVTGGAGTDAIIAVSDATNIGLRSISTVETISANGQRWRPDSRFDAERRVELHRRHVGQHRRDRRWWRQRCDHRIGRQ